MEKLCLFLKIFIFILYSLGESDLYRNGKEWNWMEKDTVSELESSLGIMQAHPPFGT